ncbi:hypothetical protein Tco_0752835 [Tanacetum coccineum]|uniref:Uncharacterized protein n=1 Tax=Tanacetum coccineum TaxID=301880 RepID=A0ABQ4Z818_9ASTR
MLCIFYVIAKTVAKLTSEVLENISNAVTDDNHVSNDHNILVDETVVTTSVDKLLEAIDVLTIEEDSTSFLSELHGHDVANLVDGSRTSEAEISVGTPEVLNGSSITNSEPYIERPFYDPSDSMPYKTLYYMKQPKIRIFMGAFPEVIVADRPDVVVRVFEHKIHDLITFLQDAKPFGNVTTDLKSHQSRTKIINYSLKSPTNTREDGNGGCKADGSLNESRFDETMPWIGIYVAKAALACGIAKTMDALHGFRYKKFCFPCKFFALDATIHY